MAFRVAVVNQKGGVGKTTTVVNLAVALAQRGKRVLLIDCDPQGSASQFLGLGEILVDPNAYGTGNLALGGREFDPQTNVNGVTGLDLVPATDSLTDLELDLMARILASPSKRLSDGILLPKQLDAIEAKYDYILADCGPTAGLTALNAMTACPHIIVPVKLDPASLLGLQRLHKIVEGARTELEPSLRILGLLGTFYRERANTPRIILEALKNREGGLIFTNATVFDTVIHESQAVADSPAHCSPILVTQPTSRAAAEYNNLADEVIARAQ